MRARIQVWLAFISLVFAVGCETQRGVQQQSLGDSPKVYALPEGLHAEGQYRPGVDPFQYPLIEVFLHNRTDKAIEWKRALLNGSEVQMLTNGVVWFQFYPTEKAAPNQTIELQINLKSNPMTPQTIEAETKDGQTVKVTLPQFSVPRVRLEAVTFRSDFKKAFIAYNVSGHGDNVESGFPKVAVNGSDVSVGVRVLCEPRRRQTTRLVKPCKECKPVAEYEPGLLSVELPERSSQGQPFHMRLEFKDGTIAQALLRAYKGLFLDAFGVDEKNQKLRKQLRLDAHPFGRLLNCDPACSDTSQGNKVGASMPSILATRKAWWSESDDRLSHVFLCTSATLNTHYSVYGQCMDAVQVNPYRLGWGDSSKFIEDEENYFRWGRAASEPRPWFWIPEAWAVRKRILEPEELRLLVYTALGHGVKGINYFTHSYDGPSPATGFDRSPRLLAEVKRINQEIKRNERIFSESIPISEKTTGADTDGVRVYTLCAGEDGLLVILKNLDYGPTSREPNLPSTRSAFKCRPKTNLRIEISKPAWFHSIKQADGTRTVSASSLITGKSVRVFVKERTIEFDIRAISLVVVEALFIPNGKVTGGKL